MNSLGLVEIAGIVAVLCLVSWQFTFFQFVRPRIMARIGRRLNVEVRESVGAWDAGAYDTAHPAPAGKTAAVAVADLVVTLMGSVGVFAAASIPLFLLADSGLPHRWEGQLTGTSVRIGDITVPVMNDRDVVALVMVRNEASDAMRACRIAVADYRARDGYLTGASDFFDLARGTRPSIELPLRVMMRVPGTHAFRISLECGQRLKDQAAASVQIAG